MASLRKRPSGSYYLEFRYQGAQYHRSLETASRTDARQLKATVERTLSLLKEGILELPDTISAAQLWQFLRSGGRRRDLPEVVISPALAEVCEAYLLSFPRGAKEESTLSTERKHLTHFQRFLGLATPIANIESVDLQRYVLKRQQQDGQHGRTISAVTISKELQTYRQLWEFAKQHGFVLGDNPTTQVRKPRGNQKLAFMAWEQIEARIGRGGLSDADVAELWDALFLREVEIGQFLEHVRSQVLGLPSCRYLYPALAFCAYTGARRSEMFRCQVDDVTNKVLLREKKRSRERQITFRDVPLHPNLKSILTEWLKEHPGGTLLFCKNSGNALEDKTSRDAFAKVTRKSRWCVLRGYHVLRHSFASNLARHGVDQYKIDQFMGHQTAEMRERYRHLFPEDGEAAIGKLDFSLPVQAASA